MSPPTAPTPGIHLGVGYGIGNKQSRKSSTLGIVTRALFFFVIVDILICKLFMVKLKGFLICHNFKRVLIFPVLLF